MYIENPYYSKTEYMYNVASGKRVDPIIRMWEDQCGNCQLVLRPYLKSDEETRCPYCGCINNKAKRRFDVSD